MADWTDDATLIAALAAGKAFTDEKAQALAENVRAMTEGGTNAPRILLPALERIVVGDVVKFRADSVFQVTTSVFTIVPGSTIGFMQQGTIRVSLEHRAVANTTETRVRRLRGGALTALTTFTTTSSAFVAATIDVAVQPGDVLDVAIRNTSIAISEVRNIRFSASANTYLWPSATTFGYIENNPTITSP